MNKEYRILIAILLTGIVGVGVWWVILGNSQIINSQILKSSNLLNPVGETVRKEMPYDKYSFERLAVRGGVASPIEVSVNKFFYKSEGRRISGEINYPITTVSNKMPVVVMARGYVDKENYKTGIGTHNAAVVYAKAGYITLAPDFSGYGESDQEDENALGARLVKPVEILDLLASLSSIPQADLSRVYLWGHSNGGQIMLSVVEILGMRESTGGHGGPPLRIRGVALWAPVSKPFPYNILYYTDEADDQGKLLRSEIANFERDYDVFQYSIDHYLDKITLPIQVHQGSADDAVPKKWSDELSKSLKEKEKQINYYVYPGADHNMKPNWNTVVSRDVEWFNKLAED
ncbi:dienelactone hydrolase family protein [Candidatus Woesebacteria bacterium]|nr:dienelactone hydrolase family protein [Candidatus Woesebacteria bacterium]